MKNLFVQTGLRLVSCSSLDCGSKPGREHGKSTQKDPVWLIDLNPAPSCFEI